MASFVLAALAGFCLLLVRPYYQNWQLQQDLERLAFDPKNQNADPAMLAAEIVNRSAQLGLPVRLDQVRIHRSEAGLFIELRYFVRVELLVYTVDLHFRPKAGVR